MACAFAQYYGIVGNGRLAVLDTRRGAGAPATVVRTFDTQDGVYDVAWNESNQNQIVTADAGGSVRLFDITATDPFPIALWKEHETEVSSVAWNYVDKSTFVSASWDRTIKVWDPHSSESVRTFTGHEYCVYQAVWSPRSPTVCASASGDKSVRVWDLKAPGPSHVIAPAHPEEVLTLDWNKYNPHIIATGSVDRTVRLWDLRSSRAPFAALRSGHSFAVRRVVFSPHRAELLASCSYDMSVCLWNTASGGGQMASRFGNIHSEFVTGLDFDLFSPGQAVSGGWDGKVALFRFA